MRTVLGVLRVVGIVLLAVVVLALTFLGYTITRSFPQTAGALTAPGLRGPVEIIRDVNGVPHLYADTPHDLFFAQGYVHAQDRFWQMDFWRHTTAGRLSELVGASQVETDMFLRTVGWWRVAEQEHALADGETRAILDAYTEGVNAYLGPRTYADLGLEYSLLALNGFDPSRKPYAWSAADSLAWGKAMAWDLSGSMDNEIMRAVLTEALGPQRTAEFLPAPPRDHPVIVPSPAVGALGLHRVRARIDDVRALFGNAFGEARRGIGSNNWVIHGSRTNTGQPLLANDPHLGIQMPAIWYLVGLHCRPVSADCPFDVVGYSLAGDPGVIIGHNARIAWGVTNVDPDVQDLFIEKINPANPNQYDVNGAWRDMTVIEETINVLGGEPVPVTIRYTRNGPLINDVFGDAESLISETVTINSVALDASYGLALRWTALETGQVFRAVLELNRAQNWDDFRNALRYWNVPAQNFVYADVDGNIGYQMPSNVPIRRSGDGTLPVPGWTDDYQWTGFIPFDELPYAFNPPQGYLATANQPVAGPEYPYLITASGFDMGYRAARINEMIRARPALSLEDMMTIHGDDKNLGAAEVLPALLALQFDDPELARAQAELRGWDLQMRMGSRPAAIYAGFFRWLVMETFWDEPLPKEYRPQGNDDTWVRLRVLMAQPNSAWWDDQGTGVIESRDDILRRAFAEGVADLKTRLGGSMEEWNWGRLHTSTFNNRVFGSTAWPAPIRALFNRGPFATSGGTSIVNATGFNLLREDPYAVTSVPSMRLIVDFSDFDNTRAIHTTGQSGHPYHAHYIDYAEKWRMIEYNTLPFTRAAVEAMKAETLTLRP
jgi:penicillin amidase